MEFLHKVKKNEQGNFVDESKTEEPAVASNDSVDCGDKKACQATDGITSSMEVNVNPANDAKTDEKKTHVTRDMNIEEILLSQI